MSLALSLHRIISDSITYIIAISNGKGKSQRGFHVGLSSVLVWKALSMCMFVFRTIDSFFYAMGICAFVVRMELVDGIWRQIRKRMAVNE